MLATFAFDVCHDVYQAAREVIDTKIPIVSLESSGKYLWHPDRMPRLSEYVADFARAGERALGNDREKSARGRRPGLCGGEIGHVGGARPADGLQELTTRSFPGTGRRASRLVMFRMFYLGGAEYQAARRQLGISEVTWADWAEEIRSSVGRELANSGVFPPSRYFREMSARAS
jgi:hypothetical protein